MGEKDVREFCFNLPKVELHAHLNTSFSSATLKELWALSGETRDYVAQDLQITTKQEEMDESFIRFSRIQELVRTKEAIYLLTCRVITEFAEENVKYLELRSTPKDIPETGMTRELYARTMVRAVRDCEKEGTDIVARLLLSIDRRHGVDVAWATVELAHRLKQETGGLVLGIDFSGDPKVGDAADFIPVFLDAHKKGLKLGLHLAEIPLYKETKEVLRACSKVCDMRIGHGTFLHRYDQGEGHDEMEDLVVENRIPIEVCLTSNIKTKTVETVAQSQFNYWRQKGHPVLICTDGKGTYMCTLTDEYVLATEAFQLTKADLKEMSLSSVDYIFADKITKEKLRSKFQELLKSI